MLVQTNRKPFDKFVSIHQLQIAQCDFQTSTYEGKTNYELNNRLNDQIIAGTAYLKVQRDLLAQDKTLMLGKDPEIAKNHQ